MARENLCVQMGMVLFPYLTGHVNNWSVCHLNTEECVSKKHPQSLTHNKYLQKWQWEMLSDYSWCVGGFFICVFSFWQTLDESLLLQTQLSRIESSSFQIMLTLTMLLPSGKSQRMWWIVSRRWMRKTLLRGAFSVCFFCCYWVFWCVNVLLNLLISCSN